MCFSFLSGWDLKVPISLPLCGWGVWISFSLSEASSPGCGCAGFFSLTPFIFLHSHPLLVLLFFALDGLLGCVWNGWEDIHHGKLVFFGGHLAGELVWLIHAWFT